MTLDEMADFVCSKLRHTDADSIAIAKEFLKARWRLVWDEQLWRESLTVVNISVDPVADPLHAAGVVLVPSCIENVVAVRNTDLSMPVTHYEELFQIGTDILADTGDVGTYVLLAPVVTQVVTGPLYFWNSSHADNGNTITIKHYTAGLGAGASSDLTGTLYTDPPGSEGMPNPFYSLDGPSEVFEITKPVTTGTVYTSGESTDVVTILAGETSAPVRQRIRLLEIPDEAMTLRVLGKRRFVALASDNDRPALRWIDNCLMGFTQADMLERDRQYGKAQAKFAEAMALLDQARRVEVHQQAFVPRLIPECEGEPIGSTTDWLQG